MTSAVGMFGTGNGRVWISNFTCNGHEPNLLACEGGGQEECVQLQDAGVRCHMQASQFIAFEYTVIMGTLGPH